MTKSRLRFLFFIFILASLTILYRSFRLQIIPPERVSRLAQRQLTREINIVGRRGAIVDQYGRELAVSSNTVSIYANPQLIENKKVIAARLAKILNENAVILEKKLDNNKKFVWIKRQLDSASLERFNQFGIEKLEGLGALPEFRRVYPLGRLASHLVGFTSIDGIGLSGSESQLNELLRGEKTSRSVHRDALGRPIFTRREQMRMDTEEGAKVQLTINAGLQHLAEKALAEAIKEHDADGGSIIVLDPNTGAIQALASLPNYDPNSAGRFSAADRRNRPVTDPIEPGSTLKPFVVAQAIDTNKLKPTTVLRTGKTIKIGSKTIGEATPKHARDTMSVAEILRYSSNVGAVRVMQEIGYTEMLKAYKKVGFGSKTGVDIAGESRGIFREPSVDQKIEQATMSYGHGIAITPLQLASAYATIANGGMQIEPHIINAVYSFDGTLLRKAEIKQKRVFKSSTTQQVRNMLKNVVTEEGTAFTARVEGISVAGKTGTSRKIDYTNGGYKAGAYWSLFTGFLPADKPQWVISVMIDEPKGKNYYGGLVAGPVFAHVARGALRLDRSEESPISIARPAIPTQHKEQKKERGQPLMPKLLGLHIRNALEEIESYDLKLEVVGDGSIVDTQVPLPNTPLRDKQPVRLKLR